MSNSPQPAIRVPRNLPVIAERVPSSTTWNLRNIPAASALVSIFALGTLALLAWMWLFEANTNAKTAAA